VPLSSTLSFERMEFAVARQDAKSWVVDVWVRLIGGTRRHGTLHLMTARSPLTVLDIEPPVPCDTHYRPTSTGVPLIEIVPRSEMPNGWHSTELHLRLLWDPASGGIEHAGPEGVFHIGAPCLLLPEMLPDIAEASAPLRASPPARLPRIHFADQLPPEVEAGGISVPNWRGKASPEFLQLVLYPYRDGAPKLEDLGIGAATEPQHRDAYEDMFRYAIPLRDFLAEELGKRPVRPVLCLVDETQAVLYPARGAYCPVLPADVGAMPEGMGKPRHLVRLLAQSWIGGGVQLWGENSSELTLAIGGALGLRWAEQWDELADVEELLASARKESAIKSTGLDRVEQILRDVGILEAHIHEGLKQPSFRRALARVVRKKWGHYVHQDDIIAMMRHHRIPLPGVFA
jgi:hypothetical protein